MSERKEKTSIQWGKWALKSAVSYAVFILMGLLLSFVPAGQIGLSEEEIRLPKNCGAIHRTVIYRFQYSTAIYFFQIKSL